MCDSSTFLQHQDDFRSTVLRFATLMSGKHCKTKISRNFRSTVLRFGNIKTIFVRQFYVFGTPVSGKQSKTTIRRPKCATVQRFQYQNSAKAIFERQCYILNQKCRKHCVSTCFCDFFCSKLCWGTKERKKKRRFCCAWQAKHDFETFYEKPKNPASAIGVSDSAFSKRKQRRFK